MQCNGFALIIVLATIFVLGWTGGVAAAVFLEEFKATEVSGQAYVLADVNADEYLELVLGSNQTVYVMTREEEKYQIRFRIDDITSGIRSLAVGDIDNDTWPDLLIGTGQAGAIRIFGWDGEKFVRKGETDYLWAPVVDILVIDIDGDGWNDILAVTETGAAQVLRWDGLRYRKIWEHSASSGRIKFFRTADINGDGVDELVYALVEGKVVVAQWNGDTLATIWENYPWGTVSAVALSDLDGDDCVEILVTTEQQMLYSYGWKQNSIVLKTSFFDSRNNFVEAIGADLDGDGKGELVTIDSGGGIKMWKIRTDRLQLVAEADFVQRPRQLRITSEGDGLILLDEDGTLHSLRLADDTYFCVLIEDTSVDLNLSPIWVDGEPLLAIRDVADLLGLTVFWDEESGRITVLGNGKYVVAEIDQLTVEISGRTAELNVAPQTEDGESYVPVQFIELFATMASWNEATRTVRIVP